MFVPRLRAVALAVTASLGLAACAYDEGYGYGGVGYASGYYGDYYGGYGYAGYPSYYGWYDDFYYPGIGFYVYDRGGHRYRWNDKHRRYWEGRRGNGGRRSAHWDGYRRGDGNWRDSRTPSTSWQGRAPSQQQSWSSEGRRSYQGGGPAPSRSYNRGGRRR
jgi:hypothetical protein